MRRLIYQVAGETPGVGPLTETLKWGEPAYLTEASKSGSTIRLGWKPAAPGRYALYFNCRTDLVDRFRSEFGDLLRFEGNRAVILDIAAEPPVAALAGCLRAALTYHCDKRAAARRR